MNSGTFHVMSQEWRYYSREKALIHTLHIAQLAGDRPGDTVLVMPVEAVKNPRSGLSFPPFPLPSGPSFITNMQQVTNSSMKITCYGAVGTGQAILAQKNMGIHVGPIGGSLSQIVMTPLESGFFVISAECYSDIHHFGVEGPANDGQITLEILNGGRVSAFAQGRIKMEGVDWSNPLTDADIIRRLACGTSCLVAGGGAFTALAFNLGNTADCSLTMWAMKVADYD